MLTIAIALAATVSAISPTQAQRRCPPSMAIRWRNHVGLSAFPSGVADVPGRIGRPGGPALYIDLARRLSPVRRAMLKGRVAGDRPVLFKGARRRCCGIGAKSWARLAHAAG